MRLRPVLAAAAAGLLIAGPAALASISTPAHDSGNRLIAGSYVVTLRTASSSSVDSIASSLASQYGGQVGFTYHSAIRGFSINHLGAGSAASLASNPLVSMITPNYVYHVDATETPAPWGLDRIDQRNLPLNNAYTYQGDGTGVHAYDIDTGIHLTHDEFKNSDGTSRASIGTDTVGDGQNGNDCAGHGTHTAGTIGSNTYGVAKKVQLVAIRVLDCSGSGSSAGIVAGIDWVRTHAIKPAVANMSLGTQTGVTDATMDAAVNNLISSGVTVAVAAGNGAGNGIYATNACNTSPARVAAALTVSATDNTDTRPIWANIGKCVDLFAPGVGVVSSWYTSDTATQSDDGTSMATPHVTGAVAAYLSANPTATTSQVAAAIVNNATGGVVKSPGSGTPNKLLYTGFIGAGSGNASPNANFTSSCSSANTTCSFTNTSTDSDGTISSSSWTFGDGGTSTLASPSHTYATAGTYTVTLTVTDNGGATGSKSSSVTAGSVSDPDPSTPNLTSGTATSGSSAAKSAFKFYKILVPAGKTSLASVLSFSQSCGALGLSCTPDLDLYVQKDVKPTTAAFACSSAGSSVPEQCTVTNPVATWYYVGIYTYAGNAGSGFTIKSTFA